MQGHKISVEIRLSRVGYFRLMSTVIKEIIYMMKDFFFHFASEVKKGDGHLCHQETVTLSFLVQL